MVFRVYIDGIFDLFHFGHVESFRKCKAVMAADAATPIHEDDIHLVVGVISDRDAASYKRPPIICEEHRIAMVRQSQYVNDVIAKAPLIIDEAFLQKHRIDMVVHGFATDADEAKQAAFFETCKRLGKFRRIDYCTETSTTDIIHRIVARHTATTTSPESE